MSAVGELLLWLFAALLMLGGIFGLMMPALPGPVLLFCGMWLAAWAEHYQRIGAPTLLVLAALAGAAMLLDVVAGALGAKRFGASRAGLLGAVLGGLLLLPFGPMGIIFGPLMGAFCGEILARRDTLSAARAGFGAWVGQLAGVLIKLVLAGTMVGIFVASYFWR